MIYFDASVLFADAHTLLATTWVSNLRRPPLLSDLSGLEVSAYCRNSQAVSGWKTAGSVAEVADLGKAGADPIDERR